MTQPDDAAIVKQLGENREEGFRWLMRKYEEQVYWHVRRLVVAHQDAQDATQETFIRVFRSIDSFKGESSLSSWIYRIATNEALRIIDRRKQDQLTLDEDEGEADRIAADEYVDYDDVVAVELQKAILSLPRKQQLAFNLRYYDEMTYEQIAEITDSTPANVKANYHVAKEKIVNYMNSIV